MSSSNVECAHSPLFVLQGHTSAVLACAFYPAPRYDATRSNLLLSGDVDGVVLLWDLQLHQPLLRLEPLALAEAQGDTGTQVGPPAFRHGAAASVLQVGFLCFEQDDAAANDAERVTHRELVTHNGARPPRPRFRLRQQRRPTSAGSAADGAAPERGGAPLFFYTQCRNQRVYLWSYDGNSLAMADDAAANAQHCRLQHSLFVPQQGFCGVAVAACGDGVMRMAVPHDTEAMISVWSITKADTRKEEEAAQQASNKDDDGAASSTLASPSMSVARGVLQVQRDCSFAAATASVNTGGIMYMAMQSGGRCMSFAFESGHVSLCQDTTTTGEQGASESDDTMQCTHKGNDDDRNDSTMPSERGFRVVALLRAFPETALVCLWQGDRVLATSAEGRIHCYRVLLPRHSATIPATNTTPTLELLWECTLGKGVGTAALQHHLALIGAWDSTVRVYDARTGRVVTVLPFHAATVNAVALLPAAVAPQAAFGYDVRRPCCYDAAHAQCIEAASQPSSDKTAEPGVYLGASASKDYTVAVWRIDFYELCCNSCEAVTPSRLLK